MSPEEKLTLSIENFRKASSDLKESFEKFSRGCEYIEKISGKYDYCNHRGRTFEICAVGTCPKVSKIVSE